MDAKTMTAHGFRIGPRRLRLVHVREDNQTFDIAGALAAERLRANEYIDRRGWIPPTMRSTHGGESDRFDGCSSHYSVLSTNEQLEVSALSFVRLIRAGDGDLPIFDCFPELKDAHQNCIEVSRYISRDPSATLALRAVIVAYLLRNDCRGIAVIGKGLRKLLRKQGLVLEDLADERLVPQYGRHPQVAVAIDADASARVAPVRHLIDAALAEDWVTVMDIAQEVQK